jgi:ABC-type bacteriocin/lantibiotic exporter with double-glycine peptidase domain
MTILRLYARVLSLLGPQIHLGWVLALANVALAAAQFAEPVLFGRIIDSLAGAQGAEGSLSWARLSPLVAAWVGFGLFMIVCGALVALYADRLAHRRRQAVLSEFFEHTLRLPLSSIVPRIPVG